MRDLIVTSPYSPYDEELDNFDFLKVDELSMLFVQSKPSTVPDWDYRFGSVIKADSAIRTSRPDAKVASVLDRLPDHGAKLTRLGISLDYRTQ